MSASNSWSLASYSADPNDNPNQPAYAYDRPSWMEPDDSAQLPYSELKQRDAMIFLVDVSEAMQPTAEEQSQMQLTSKQTVSSVKLEDGDVKPSATTKTPPTNLFSVLSRIEGAVRSKIITSPDDLIGVILFGSNQQHDVDDGNNFDYIYVLQSLEQPGADLVRRLRDFAQNPKLFDKQIGSAPKANAQVDRALWTCSTQFTRAANLLKRATKRIMIITSNDLPIDTADPNAKARAVQKSRDLRDNNTVIDVLPIHPHNATGRKFNTALFDQLMGNIDPSKGTATDVNKSASTAEETFADFDQQFMKKVHTKRSLGSIEWQISESMNIAVKVYALYLEAKKESPIFLDKQTNQPLKADTKYVDTETGDYVGSFDIKKYYPYAGEQVFFTDEEMRKIKGVVQGQAADQQQGDAIGLTLLGFKPLSALKVSHHVKSPYFIYPNDGSIRGSRKLFIALMNAMLSTDPKHEKVAICRFRYRKTSVPRFVALKAQAEVFNELEGQVTPPGMHLIFLPYADDIRDLKFAMQAKASREQVDAAKQLVAKMTISGVKDPPYNPSLQKHYSIIEALALDEPMPENLEDATRPDVEGFRTIKSEIDAFKDSVYGESGTADVPKVKAAKKESPAKKPAATKRKVAEDSDSDGASSSRARVKREDEDADEPSYSDYDWTELADNGQLKKQTVNVLKLYLRHHKLPLSGAKQALLDRIEEHMSK